MLVMSQKATVLKADDAHPVEAISTSFDRPSVIVLSRYVRVPYARRVPLTRRGVLRRDGHSCAYCSRPANTIDHVQPRSKGGRDTWENLVACCFACNNRKGDKTLAEIGWKLNFTPRMPSGTVWSVRGTERLEPDWNPYLQAA